MSARRKTMGRYIPKYPELDQQLFEWFMEQRSQGDETKMKLICHAAFLLRALFA